MGCAREGERRGGGDWRESSQLISLGWQHEYLLSLYTVGGHTCRAASGRPHHTLGKDGGRGTHYWGAKQWGGGSSERALLGRLGIVGAAWLG